MKKSNLFKMLPFVIIIAMGTSDVCGQIVAWNNYTLSGITSGTLNSTTNNENLISSVLSRGSGITPSSLNYGYSSTGWNVTTEALAKSGNLYYQLTIASNADYKVSLSTLDARIRRSSTGPNAYIWCYSTDGINFVNIGTPVSFTTNSSSGDVQPQISLATTGPLQNKIGGTTVYLRLYAWGATSGSGSLAFGTTNANSLSVGGVVDNNMTQSSGTGNWSAASSWISNVVPPNEAPVLIRNALVADQHLNVSSLTIQPDASLTVHPAKQLTVSATLTNNGSLNLLSDETGTATILTPAATDGSGSFHVSQYLSSGRNWYISNPVDAVVPSVSSATLTFFRYNEPTAEWVSTTEALEVGQGYVATVSADRNITFTGTLNKGNKTLALSHTASVAKQGFNLAGNPYPSYLTWNQATANDPAANLATPTLWYRTRAAGAYVFHTYNPSGAGTGVPETVTASIPPMQAFWVRVAPGGGTLTFSNALRTHGSGSNPLKAKMLTEQQLLRLQLSNGNAVDETVIYFNDNAQDGFDPYDSPKMTNASVLIPEIYSTIGAEHMVINGFRSLSNNKAVALGFMSKTAATFTVKTIGFNNFPPGTRVLLRDNVLKKEQDIGNGSSYNFSSEAADQPDRFTLIFQMPDTTAALDKVQSPSFWVYSNADNRITVNCRANAGTIVVSNAWGQGLLNMPIRGENTVIPNSFGPGVYLITLHMGSCITTQKLIRFNTVHN